MRREALAWPWCTLAVRIPAALRDQGLYRRNAGRDLLEDKGMLFVIDRGCQLLRTPSKAGPIKSLQDLRQPLDAFVGVSVPGLEVINLFFQSLDAARLLGHGENHSFQGAYSDEAGAIPIKYRPPFRFEAGRSFRFHSGRRSDLKAAICRTDPGSF